MSESEVGDFVTYAKRIIDRSPQMNEETTKARIIQPLLERLGWDITTDIELEYSVSMHGRNHSIDYALMLEEKPSLFVEAKGADTILDEGHGEQLETYMKQQNVNWGLLTNAKSYRVMYRRTENGDVHVVTLGTVSLEDLPSRENLWRALTKESIKKGEASEIAEHIQEINRTIAKLAREKDDIADDVTQLVSSTIGESVSNIIESEAKTFVDNLIRSLEDETAGISSVDPDRDRDTGDTSGFWAEIDQAVGISQTNSELHLPENQPANVSFAQFVEYLVTEEYISDDDIPITSGPTRYVLHSEPVDRNGDPMHNPKEIDGRLYLETHMSVDDINRRILELGEEFGPD